jgi:phospholipid-transporting ATPase
VSYLDFSQFKDSWGLIFIKTIGTWVLILTNFVPISMLVTLEVIKFWQGMFMTYDVLMIDKN